MAERSSRILIVDDDPDFVATARTVLDDAGYQVAECSRAREAIACVREFRPDLVILDVMMETGTAGFHVSYEIRRDPDFTRVPILMVTAIHQTTPLRFSPETDGEYLPVQRLLDKPVAPDAMLAAVKELLAKTRGVL
jgi:CheY-like chemotaxis protein